MHPLTVTRMDGPEDANPVERQNPVWEDIELAIRRLDGKSCTLLNLGIGDGPVPHLAIGGGHEGKYVVYATFDNTVFFGLANAEAGSEKCLLVAGGQPGYYESKRCVALPEVLRAAKTYAETGQLDQHLLWQEW